MDTLVYSAVLLAAILHGAWNVLVKTNADRLIALFVIHAVMGAMGLVALTYTGLPAPAALPYAIASGLLHTGYNLFLARAYRHGEMSLVYPLARGAAPLFALIFSLLAGADRIQLLELVPLAILVLGLWLVALGRTARIATDGSSVAYAIGTAVFIGFYTVTDGVGARVAGDALAFIGLIYALDGLFIILAGLFLRGPAVFAQARPFLGQGSIGASFAGLAYGLVVWAMTQAPIAVVAALRETSILFVLAMSAIFLKERLTPLRVAGGVLIVAGAAALRFV